MVQNFAEKCHASRRMTARLEEMTALRAQFLLDPRVAYLNHGAYGATPRPIQEIRSRLLREIELNPTRTFLDEMKESVDAARGELARALAVPAETLAFTPNATVGLNLVARSIMPLLQPGDEVVLTDVEYGSQVKLWEFVCARRDAQLRIAPVCGLASDEVGDAVEASLTERTRVVQVSHVSSLTALRLPVAEVAGRLRRHDVVFIADGAHTPGHIALDLSSVGADYYVANLHKWYAAPRPAGFIYASPDAQSRLDPLVVNWGGSERDDPLADRTHFPGTSDASPWLSVPAAIAFHAEWLAPARSGARNLLGAAADELERLGFGRLGRQEDDLLMSSWWLPSEIDPAALRDRFAASEIVAVVGEQAGRSLLRICVAWYTVESEVERLIEACRQVARPSGG